MRLHSAKSIPSLSHRCRRSVSISTTLEPSFSYQRSSSFLSALARAFGVLPFMVFSLLIREMWIGAFADTQGTDHDDQGQPDQRNREKQAQASSHFLLLVVKNQSLLLHHHAVESRG